MEEQGEAQASRQWSYSTTWTESETSLLESSISFETSVQDCPALTSNGSVLTRPGSANPPPCDVTIFLGRKHEIHRIYAKSTARTFEVYFSKDGNLQSDEKEYLCTVKCGPAALSVANDSVHSSEEETWVDVKVPEPSMHYEATAELSDVDPCVSLTLRFLSLHNKSSIHIEEIYILADPLDESSSVQNSRTGTAGNFNTNFDASSMFAMLVPNLLQMSRSGLSDRINDQYFASERIQKIEGQTAKFQNPVYEKSIEDQTAKLQTPVTENINIQEPPNQIEKNDFTEQADQEILINTETSNINFKQVNQEACVSKETEREVGRTSQVEKLLEQLVCKVETMETNFTKFEEKMVGPISEIQTRLFNLENRFDQFSTDLQSLKPKDNSVADGVAGHSQPVSNNIEVMLVNLERRFDQFSQEIHSLKVAPSSETKRENSVADGVAGHSRPGFRAPDFISDDDSTDDDDILNDNIINDSNIINNDNSGSKRKPISIDGALASALAAFASGSRSDPTESDPNPTVEIDCGDKMNGQDFADQTGRVGEIPVKCLDSEGVPLVFMDEVRIESVSVSDPFLSFEEIPHEMDQNVDKMSGFEREMKELDPNSDRLSGFEKEIDELDRNLDQINELDQNLGEIDEGTTQGSDDGLKNNEGFFYKSAIGEISDEEEDLGFGSDLHRFACNRPLSETGSDFESNFPSYSINNNDNDNNSTDSSFDENFLKSRVQIDLSDNESTESGSFHKTTLKSSEIGEELNFGQTTGVDSTFVQDLLGEIQGNISSLNGPLIDLELEEDLINSTEKNGTVEQFESLI